MDPNKIQELVALYTTASPLTLKRQIAHRLAALGGVPQCMSNLPPRPALPPRTHDGDKTNLCAPVGSSVRLAIGRLRFPVPRQLCPVPLLLHPFPPCPSCYYGVIPS